MAVLITGGAGFIGLNIMEKLLGQGCRVISYGLEAPPEAFMAAVDALPGQLETVVGDVRDRQALRAALGSHQVKQVVHGAAITAGMEREAREAPLIISVNFGGTIEVLEAALAQGVTRVIQLGSGAVFGPSVKQDGLLDEEADIPVPESLYGICKYASERAALRYRSTRGLDVTVVRLGTCFGPWEYDTGVRDTLSIPLHLTALAEEGGHAVFASNLPSDWVYARDVGDGISHLLGLPAIASSLYHLSSGHSYCATDWCERLRQAYPSFSFEISDEPSRRNVGVLAPSPRPPFSVRKLKAETGFSPRYSPGKAFTDYLAWRTTQKNRPA